MRRFVTTVVVVALCAVLSGCGWLRAGSGSRNKPNGFVLRGYASVEGAPAGQVGSPCQVPNSGVTPGTPLKVTDPPGHTLAIGTLGSGVLAAGGGAYRCNFPFEIYGVPGGHTTYEISVDDRPAVSFPANELREDKPAVVPISSP